MPPDFVIDTYKESVPMSTYLVAFAVTDFRHLSEKKFHVWARQEAIDQARYAMTLGSKILSFYEEFFQIGFPLPKMDMIALPDFGSGAMENWGLITYRYLFTVTQVEIYLLHFFSFFSLLTDRDNYTSNV